MPHAPLEIIAPGLLRQDWREAEALGYITWLWLHSAFHRDMPLHGLGPMVLPALKHRQFILALEVGKPVFYLSWAHFDAAAETRYLSQHPVFMPESDWQSGERMWFLDWVAPFGHTRRMVGLLKRELLSQHWVRSLCHRGDERGLRIKTFRGDAVAPALARQWFASHPVHWPEPAPACAAASAAASAIPSTTDFSSSSQTSQASPLP